MVTSTTSTTATPTPTPAATPANAQSVVNAATQSLLASLNAGSGIDTGTLVPALVTAQFATKTAALTAKSTALTSQISGISSLKSAITTFSSALDSLVKGGTLQTQPTSSDISSISATAISGAKVSTLSSTISVTRLATAQVAGTKVAIDRTKPLGSGNLTLTVGTAIYTDAKGNSVKAGADGAIWAGLDPDVSKRTAFTITVGANDTMDMVAASINATKSGVTASVVSDGKGGAFLSVKGATGDAQAFTLKGANSNAIDVGPPGSGASNTQLSSSALNAQLTVDGIPVERSSNTISDLVDGVKLQLSTISKAPVTLSSTPPTDGLTQAVNDVVETYNQILAIINEQTDPVTGVLRADPAAASLLRSLKALTLKPLATGAAPGVPTTLAEIGVATNRDGTLRVDTAQLAKQIGTNPAGIEAMFAPSTSNPAGLSVVLGALAKNATSTTAGLGASTARYTAAQSDVAKEQDKITAQADQMTTRLTQQYASMNSRVSAYKSTQTFLTNQIAAWNKSD
ncbi:hypothetical protein ASE69_05935 [Sphingomonas sp. Leaf208]|jgi:flagellar hook-associated protein 2|uniref:flagellar filament capping protein FliD n=1 Tax=Sphingomonas sp. Leaf208 TaxID=1735679 RepID=UPI0006F36CAD|nr:flagellar filament capping protein FliD [Sphingomonas sp. Leaf208]KQM53296.1 hypothetical protein ASE69_05935 [Sphingomonas sp. Leaf208]